MPLDILGDLNHFYHRAQWKSKFALWPQRCVISGRCIFFETAYQGTAIYTGPGEPVYEHHWIEKNEFLLWNLKGKK
jgi:hypothetical protein